MASSDMNAAQIADSLKSVLYPFSSDDTERLEELIKAFVAISHKALAGDEGVQRAVAEMSCHLAVLVEASISPGLLILCFRALLNMGRTGLTVACKMVRKRFYNLDELKIRLKSFRQREVLGLLDELLRRPDQNDRELSKWIAGVFQSIKNDLNKKEACIFLRGLALSRMRPSFQVRLHLAGEDFRLWLEKALKTVDGKTLSLAGPAALVLDDPELNEAYVEAMGRADSDLFEYMIFLAGSVGPRSEPAFARGIVRVMEKLEDRFLMNCIDCLLRLKAANLGLIMAMAYYSGKVDRDQLALRAAALPEFEFRRFMDELGGKEQEHVCALVFAVASRMGSGFLREGLESESACGMFGAPGMSADEVFEVLAENASQGVFPENPRPVLEKTQVREESGGIIGFFGGIAKSRNKLSALAVKNSDIEGGDFSGQVLEDAAPEKVSWQDGNFSGTRFKGVEFTDVVFDGSDFTGAEFEAVKFIRCGFSNNRFEHARMTGCVFTDSNIIGCDFNSSFFSRCLFDRMEVNRSFFSFAWFEEVSVSLCRILKCGFVKVTFRDGTMASSRVVATDMSSGWFWNSQMWGVEMESAILDGVIMENVGIWESVFSNCLMVDMGIRSVFSNDPELMSAGQEFFIQWLCSDCQPEDLSLPEGFSARNRLTLRRMAQVWSRRVDRIDRSTAMLRENRRKLGMALSRMNPRQKEFFLLLPHLLDTDIFDKAQGLENVPPCRVHNLFPDFTAATYLKKHFPDIEASEAVQAPLSIEAVYTIGSVGSVAQTAESDVDYWVCYDGANVSAQDIQGLNRKLLALSNWAEQEFGLEAYFFAMDMEAVRNNDFGFSDKESSGSAQSLLLKEEFYRTSLRVAGRGLGWWLVPPGADGRTYDSCLEDARVVGVCNRMGYTDMGRVGILPAEEFFGASLWQMVKGVGSPFKSVMKLGLLELYADLGETGLSLSDRFKQSVMENSLVKRHLDPYFLLYRTLAEYYTKIDDRDALSLIRVSFDLKSKISKWPLGGKEFLSQEEYEVLDYFTYGAQDYLHDQTGMWTYKKSIDMSKKVNRFMISAYKRMQQGLKKSGAKKAMINPKDLTKLGRRIFSVYLPQKGKLLRMPLVEKMSGLPEELYLVRGSNKAGKVWNLKAMEKFRSVNRDQADTVCQDKNIVRILAWIVANAMFKPGVRVESSQGLNPVAISDVKNLLQEMWEMFPIKATFEPDVEEGLKPEIVTKMLLVLNFNQQRSEKLLLEVQALFCTNWGELFLTDVACHKYGLANNPVGELSKACGKDLSKAEIKQFIPKQAQVKRLVIV